MQNEESRPARHDKMFDIVRRSDRVNKGGSGDPLYDEGKHDPALIFRGLAVRSLKRDKTTEMGR